MTSITSMNPAERAEFLAGLHVGVLAIPEPGRGPLTVPVWYDYRAPAGVWFITDRESRKGRLLQPGVRISLCAQTEAPPYRYVSVEGVVAAVEPADTERHLRPMARRYLGDPGGDEYVARVDGAGEDSIVVHLRPERWLTVDYGKR